MQTPPDRKKTRLITLCRHDLPSAPSHLDLFLGPEGPVNEEEAVVRTWRLNQDPMSMKEGASQPLTPLPLHRGRYLHLEGPVEPRSTDGLVTPLRRGSCLIEESEQALRFTIRWDDGSQGRFEMDQQRMLRLPLADLSS